MLRSLVVVAVSILAEYFVYCSRNFEKRNAKTLSNSKDPNIIYEARYLARKSFNYPNPNKFFIEKW